jgi:beta-phosphoglucomutase
MLRAVIFDFDGVITDSEILHLRAFNYVLAPYGTRFSTEEYYKNYLGLSDFDLFALLIEKNIVRVPPAAVDTLVKQKNGYFEHLAKTEGKIIEGVRDLLSMLRSHNISMAICSGALRAEIELILGDANLRSFFQTIVSAEQVKKGKPDPQGFLLALARLNEKAKPPISAAECVVIEDSHWGLEAANNAGMHSVAITNSYPPDQLGMAETVVTHLNELTIDRLKRLCD